MSDDNLYDDMWRQMLTTGMKRLHTERFLFNLLPSEPRCTVCKAPFSGVGYTLLHTLMHLEQSPHNPRYCNMCQTALTKHPGGAEVNATLMFADVRGSTRIAETMSPSEFSQLMDRFYTLATNAIIHSDGLIEKFVGDEVASIYVPGYAGKHYTRKAIEAAMAILDATGHNDPQGPWLPVGIGIHHGNAYVGMVGSGGVIQLTVLGDIPNTAARLASSAKQGEIFISDAAYDDAMTDVWPVEPRQIELKGKSEPFSVRVWQAESVWR